MRQEDAVTTSQRGVAAPEPIAMRVLSVLPKRKAKDMRYILQGRIRDLEAAQQ
jgi:hypothetical protein